MAVQLGVNTRNARLDSVETVLGTAPLLTIRTGAQPANCAAANAGTVLATIALPSDWMAAATAGTKSILGGPWQDVSADAGGTAAHFRVHNTAGTVCELQGSVGQGTGDMQLDNVTIVAGQTVSITSFTLTDGNA
jgi:hypothetical protein